MSLPTAPCTRCRSLVVYGELRCRSCGEHFSYGNPAPPQPNGAQIAEALIAADSGFEDVHTSPGSQRLMQAYQRHVQHAAAQDARAVMPEPQNPTGSFVYRSGEGAAVASQEGAPVSAEGRPVTAEGRPVSAESRPISADGAAIQMDPMVDTERAADVGQVRAEPIPGLIDSRLFGAMTPDRVQVERVPGLEMTSTPPMQAALPDDNSLEGWLDTGRFEQTVAEAERQGALRTEEVPGLIDSRLFAKFTPAEVQTERVAGLEQHTRAGTRREAPKDEDRMLCLECGAARVAGMSACTECGSRRFA